MTMGVRVIWRNADKKTFEIDYSYGIDVDHLDDIPDFNTVQSVYPEDDGAPPVEFVVEVHCERNRPGEVRLAVVYRPDNNPELAEKSDDISWGTNTIVLEQGHRDGHCEWLPEGGEESESRVTWKAFDLGTGCARTRAKYFGSKHEGKFRAIILACDNHRCVLTGKETRKALDAAHLIPAAMGENDVPCNGITLRADLHRLFDGGLFTFSANGRVVELAPEPELSAAYRERLRNKPLPPSALGRGRRSLSRNSRPPISARSRPSRYQTRGGEHDGLNGKTRA